ncbi:50S ribosome-binding GTPase [Candidatus Woesearchaeota archaeon]|nr:50S ribosome-binding GTPase [Candidatus Woesearchaeota archaeon]
MANFWRLVDSVLNEADIVLMVVDARIIEETRNKEIERKVHDAGKILITVINKADLVEKDTLEPYKKLLHPCVFVSAQKFYGMTKLRHTILRYAEGREVVVGVVGYPNTGKSSVINALKGKASAGVSSQSGFTKGRQLIRIDNKITILDTPGVLADSDEKQSARLVVTASTTKTKDPEGAVFELFKTHKQEIISFYGVVAEKGNDEEDILEAIANKLNRKKQGGLPDTFTAAKIILKDWQKGNIVI